MGGVEKTAKRKGKNINTKPGEKKQGIKGEKNQDDRKRARKEKEKN